MDSTVSSSKSPAYSASPEQQGVIDTWGQGMAVLAGAGSGKTTTLVTKCLKLLELNPKARFAAVSFTERSASDLRAKLSERLLQQGNAAGLHEHWIMTIHGLCGAILKEYPREGGFDGEETVLTESQCQLLWEAALEALWLDEVPPEVSDSLDLLLDRESQMSLTDLLRRVRDLASFGALDSIRTQEEPASQALYQVGRFVIDRYTRLKRRRGALDFQDLELGADRALNHAWVRDSFQKRFHLVLVDEFQDTNPIQAQLIWKLVQPGGANLCVVGDPKQSIYRFRDADVSVFEEFCARLPVQKSLTWNFRSRPGIIEFSNEICSRAFAASGMPFEPLIAQRQAHPEWSPIVKLHVRSPADLAQWIRSENEKGVPLADMALLVRKIRGHEKWFKALMASGIPIAIGSGGLFWGDPRVRELVAFLRWWDLPAHTLSGAIFLRAPWMEISDSTLDQWVRQDPTFQTPFFNSMHPIARRLLEFRQTPVRPGELLLALLVNQALEDELWSPLLGLWHRVEEYSSSGMEFHEILQELTRAIEESRRDREVPAPRNLGQLSVLTFHGAKGLEFPHVLLIDFGLKPKSSDAPLLFWDRNQGAFLGVRDDDGQRDQRHPEEARWRQIEKEKNLAESKRIFYVALTRARERLVLTCPEPEDAESLLDSAVFAQDHWRNWIETSSMSVQEVRPAAIEVGSNSGSLSEGGSPSALGQISPVFYGQRVGPKRARHSVTEWSLLARCPRAYEWTFIRPKLSTPAAENKELELEDSLDLGTQVHRYLELGRYAELTEIEKQVGEARFNSKQLEEWALNSAWMAPPDLNHGRDVWTELAFEVPIEGEVLVGSVDRLIQQAEEGLDRYSMIDFKVAQHPKSAHQIIHAYSTQIQLYAWAIQTLRVNRERPFTFEASVVHISSGSVQSVPIPIDLGRVNSLVNRLREESLKVIAGQVGEPRRGSYCQFCRHEQYCVEDKE